jgi:nicotinamide riboside kinase
VAARRSPLGYADVDAIARGQVAAEDRVTGAVPVGLDTDRRLILLDTDLLSTIVYGHHYYGDCPAWISAELERRPADLYLLAGIDVPWVADGHQRDRGDRREEMQGLFREALFARGLPFAPIRGDRERRLEAAITAIAGMLGT